MSGVIDASGLGLENGGDIAIMSLDDVQKMFGKKALSSINLILQDKSDVLKEKERIQTIVGKGRIVSLPKEKSDYYLQTLNGLFLGLNIFGIIALIVGGFLIYNTMSANVINSSKEFAILKANGANYKNIITWIIMQGTVYGFIGSFLGVLLGIALSKLMLLLMTYSVSGENIQIGLYDFPVLTMIAVGIMGVVVSIMASIIPAIKASKVTVLDALSKRSFKRNFHQKFIAKLFFVDIVLGGISILASQRIPYLKIATMVLIVAGILLLIFLVLKPVSVFAESIMRKISPLNSQLIRSNLMNNTYRTGSTIFALVICISMGISYMGTVNSMKASLSEWADSMFQGDLMAYPAIDTKESILNELSKNSDICSITPMYQNDITALGTNIRMLGINPRANKFNYLGTEREEVINKLGQKNTVVLSTVLRDKRKVAIGDKIDVPSNQGITQLTVIGFINTLEYDGLTIYVSPENFRNLYPGIRFEAISITLDKNVQDKEKTIQELQQKYKDRLSFYDMKLIINSYKGSSDNLYLIFYVVIGLAFLVSALVIANSMIMSIFEKKYQISLLKSFGMKRFQMVSSIASTGFVYGVISAIFGTVGLHDSILFSRPY